MLRRRPGRGGADEPAARAEVSGGAWLMLGYAVLLAAMGRLLRK